MIQIWNTRYKFESPPGLPNKKSVQIDLAICFVYDPLWWGVNKKKKQKNKKTKKQKFKKWSVDMDRLDLTQGRDRWLAVVNTVINLMIT